MFGFRKFRAPRRVAAVLAGGVLALSLTGATTALAYVVGHEGEYTWTTKVVGDPTASCSTVWKYMDDDGVIHMSEAYYKKYVLRENQKVKCTNCGELFDTLDEWSKHSEENIVWSQELGKPNTGCLHYVWVENTDSGWVEVDGN